MKNGQFEDSNVPAMTTASAYFKVSIDLTPVGLLYQEEFKDTKGVIRIGKSKNDRQHNRQKKKDNNLQNIKHKTKDQVT